MAEFEDSYEIENPLGMIVATRYELRVGFKANEDGLRPYVSATMIGHPHLDEAGAVDLTRTVQFEFLLWKEDAELFAAQYAQACLERP